MVLVIETIHGRIHEPVSGMVHATAYAESAMWMGAVMVGKCLAYQRLYFLQKQSLQGSELGSGMFSGCCMFFRRRNTNLEVPSTLKSASGTMVLKERLPGLVHVYSIILPSNMNDPVLPH